MRSRPSRSSVAAGHRLGLISVCSQDVPHVWDETPFAGAFDELVFSCDVGDLEAGPADLRDRVRAARRRAPRVPVRRRRRQRRATGSRARGHGGRPAPGPRRAAHPRGRGLGMASRSSGSPKFSTSPRAIDRSARTCVGDRATVGRGPARRARARALSLLRTCMSTVRGLRKSWWAISRFVRPTATRRRISSSRRVRPPCSRSRAARRPRRSSTRSPAASRSAAVRVRERARAELPERVVRTGEPLDPELPLARGDQRSPARACVNARSKGASISARRSSACPNWSAADAASPRAAQPRRARERARRAVSALPNREAHEAVASAQA